MMIMMIFIIDRWQSMENPYYYQVYQAKTAQQEKDHPSSKAKGKRRNSKPKTKKYIVPGITSQPAMVDLDRSTQSESLNDEETIVQLPSICTIHQHAGQILYVPRHYSHQVTNLNHVLGFAWEVERYIY
jgi:hypothetical protein